jgi:hypothetical protein
MSLPLTLNEIKELISFSRAQKVQALELGSLRFQFSVLAHEPEAPPEKREPTAKSTPEAPFGHFVPE